MEINMIMKSRIEILEERRMVKQELQVLEYESQ